MTKPKGHAVSIVIRIGIFLVLILSQKETKQQKSNNICKFCYVIQNSSHVYIDPGLKKQMEFDIHSSRHR